MRFSVIVTCAALAFTGSAYAQGRPAPRQAAPAAVNPALALPANMPKLATDPALLLAQINTLTAQVAALQKLTAELQQVVSGLQEHNANQESRIDSVATRLESHQHVLPSVGFKTVPSVTCLPQPGGYPSCKPDQWPTLSLIALTAGDADKSKALTTSKPIK